LFRLVAVHRLQRLEHLLRAIDRPWRYLLGADAANTQLGKPAGSADRYHRRRRRLRHLRHRRLEERSAGRSADREVDGRWSHGFEADPASDLRTVGGDRSVNGGWHEPRLRRWDRRL